MLPPVDVTPPLSNALRYSSATDLRCSSVIVSLVTVMADLLQGRGYHGGRSASTLTHTDLVSVYSCIASNPISRPYPELRMPPNGDPGFTRLYELTQTIPLSMACATRWARWRSRVHSPPPRPYSVAFAISSASASSRNVVTVTKGPNTSSRHTRSSSPARTTVGST